MAFAVLVRLTPRLDLAPPSIRVEDGASYLIIQLVAISASLLITSFLAAPCQRGCLLLQQTHL